MLSVNLKPQKKTKKNKPPRLFSNFNRSMMQRYIVTKCDLKEF